MKFKTLVLATVIGAIAVSGCGILNGKPAKVEPTEQSVLNYCKNNIKGFEEVKPTLGILSSDDRNKIELFTSNYESENSFEDFKLVVGYKTKGVIFEGHPLIEELLWRNGNSYLYDKNATSFSDLNYLELSYKFQNGDYMLPFRGVIHNYKNNDDYAVLRCEPIVPQSYDKVRKGEYFPELAERRGDSVTPLSKLESVIYKMSEPSKFARNLTDHYVNYADLSMMRHDGSNTSDRWVKKINIYEKPEICADDYSFVSEFILDKDYLLYESFGLVEKIKNKYTFKLIYKEKGGTINKVVKSYSLKKGDEFTIGNLTFRLLSFISFPDGTRVKLQLTKFDRMNLPQLDVDKISRLPFSNSVSTDYYNL